MTNQKIIVPDHWAVPKYSFAQRTKQGIILGMQYYPANSVITGLDHETWRYAIANKNDFTQVSHIEEQKVQPLTIEELRAELTAEIKQCEREIKIRVQQLKQATESLAQ